MGKYVVRKPMILYETIETIFRYVNGRTVAKEKEEFLKKYGNQLSPAHLERIELLSSHLEEVYQVCEAIPESPKLAYYFQRWDMNSNWLHVCLAKLMIYSFFDFYTTDYQEALDRTYEDATKSLAMPVVLTEIRSAALEFRSLEPGEQPVSLAEQLDGIKIQEQYRWRLYKVLSDYPQAFNELRQLIDPVASALEAVFEQLRPLLVPTYDYWQECLERYSISELMRRMTNQDLEVHATDISINVGVMGFREMIWGYGNKEETCYRICIGSFLSEDTCIDRRAMSNERICNLLKVISDSSKFEILCRISRESSYCQEIAKEMGLSTATVSRHMGLLMDAGFVHPRKGKNRICYDVDRQAISEFCETVQKTLLGENGPSHCG